MTTTSALYKHSLALLTDLYQITMAYGYWKLGRHEQQAVFHHTFRRNPFAGGYSITCGLHYAIDFLPSLRFDEADAAYPRSLTGNDGQPLLEPAFMEYLREMQ